MAEMIQLQGLLTLGKTLSSYKFCHRASVVCDWEQVARFMLADNIRKLKRLINMSFFVECKEAGMQFEVQLNQQGRGRKNQYLKISQ